MVFLAMALSVLIVGFGVWGILSPTTLLAFLSRWQTRERAVDWRNPPAHVRALLCGLLPPSHVSQPHYRSSV